MMKQIALARRLRPRNFQAVVGQEVTIQAFSNALKAGRLHHAYLFTGTRGVGKTTLARIFAKCMNCEQGISATPCGKCDTCLSIDEGRCIDVLEVDAASRTKVEDTRELLENVQYLPSAARFKIYLIDEVHMLSSHSFNALLKTLEEPPPHVKFLFATTDPQKLPITVLSRCLQFHLHRLTFIQIVSYLQQVLAEEKMTFELSALEDIGRHAEGSLRDALSLLEQAIAYTDGHLTVENVRKMLGLTEASRLLRLLQAIFGRCASVALQEIEALADSIPDFSSMLSELLVIFRNIAILQEAPDALEESLWQRETMLEWANKISAEELQLYYQIGVLGQKELPYAPSSRIGFEMIILRMLAFQPCAVAFSNPTSNVALVKTELPSSATVKKSAAEISAEHSPKPIAVTDRIPMPIVTAQLSSTIEREGLLTSLSSERGEQAILNSNDLCREESLDSQSRVLQTAAISSSSKTEPMTLPLIKPIVLTAAEWPILVSKLNLVGITRQLAENCTLAEYSNHFLHLLLEESQRPLLQTRHEEKLKQVISEHMGCPIRLKITVGKVPQGVKTPAAQYQQQQEESYQAAKQIMETDPKLNDMIKTFGAKIEKIEIEQNRS